MSSPEEPRIDFLYTQPNYWDHQRPIWEALPPRNRGYVYSQRKGQAVPPGDNLIVVSGFGDSNLVANIGRRSVWADHGVGQTFVRPGYKQVTIGGIPIYRLRNTALALVTGPATAKAFRTQRPDIPLAEVGSPMVDQWVGQDSPPLEDGKPVVAISFHWDNRAIPEHRSAWRYYLGLPGSLELRKLAKRYKVLGHGHPRLYRQIEMFYDRLGIEAVPTFSEVVQRAHLYIADCTSTIYEFAVTERPVVLINLPFYRRGVEHGMRFWSASHVGVHCNDPKELNRAVDTAMAQRPGMLEAQKDALSQVYYHWDGSSSHRAAEAILEAARDNR